MTIWELVLFWLSLVNVTAFMTIAVSLGGDAINGTSGDGHYFLGSHGKYVEVSEGVFRYSFTHTLIVLVTQPLGIWAALRGRRRARKLES